MQTHTHILYIYICVCVHISMCIEVHIFCAKPPSFLATRQVLSVIAQQLLQLFSAKRELTSYNDAWHVAGVAGWDGA